MGKKKVPSYWWDMSGPEDSDELDSIIVESDRRDLPIVAAFYVKSGKSAAPQIKLAEQLIKDLEEGRISL